MDSIGNWSNNKWLWGDYGLPVMMEDILKIRKQELLVYLEGSGPTRGTDDTMVQISDWIDGYTAKTIYDMIVVIRTQRTKKMEIYKRLIDYGKFKFHLE